MRNTMQLSTKNNINQPKFTKTACTILISLALMTSFPASAARTYTGTNACAETVGSALLKH